jgi:DNA-binding SARP family transcriptional activator
MIEDAIEIRAFGPLRVTRDGIPRACGGSAERAVLAALLLWPAQPVGVERLSRTAWDRAHMPRDAAHAIQTHVMRLRHHLGPDFIETDHHGYRVAVGPEAVDTHRFSSRAEHAEQFLRTGRLQESEDLSATALADADGGDPWLDLVGRPRGEGERARLLELRLRSEERCIALALRLGHPAVGQPERLCGQEPLREERWELLMRAQVMAGRQADALLSYTRARLLLATELGLSPGRGLRDLERRILQQDPILARPESISELLR